MKQGKKIKVRNEIDRFGFSNIISTNLNYNSTPRSYANWSHGWFWADPKDKNLDNKLDLLLGYPKKFNYNVPTVLANNMLKNALIDYGFTNVYSGGLPFIYTIKKNVKKKHSSLLVILPHSISYMNFSAKDMKNIDMFLEKIYTFKKDFLEIDCLVFQSDVLKKTFNDLIKKYNFNLITGAKPDYSESLSYIREVFEKYSFVTSCCLSSGLLYSMFCGGKASIIEPIFEHSSDFFNCEPYNRKHKLVDVILYKESKKYLLDNFSFLVKDHPLQGYANIEFAKQIIGYHHKIEFKEIEKILSWQFLPKISLAGKYFIRKLNSLIH